MPIPWPSEIANLAVRFEVRSGLKDAGGAFPDDAEDVSTWEDMTGDYILAGTLFSLPSYSSSGYNGYGKLVFTNAQNEGMLLTGLSTPSLLTGTIIVAFKQTAVGPASFITNLVTGDEPLAHYEHADGDRRVGGGGLELELAAAADTSIHIDVVKMRGDNTTEVRVDGTDGVTGDAGNGGVLNAIYLNRSAGNAFQGDLEMIALVVYSSVITDEEIRKVEYYLDQTYSLGLSIPGPTQAGGGMATGVGAFPYDG